MKEFLIFVPLIFAIVFWGFACFFWNRADDNFDTTEPNPLRYGSKFETSESIDAIEKEIERKKNFSLFLIACGFLCVIIFFYCLAVYKDSLIIIAEKIFSIIRQYLIEF